MRWINCFALLSISILFIQGCDFQFSDTRQKEIDQKILAKISQDISFLANLEASYSVNYINFRDNPPIPFVKDDFYIRNDIRTYFYGYSLKDADIKVITENNQRILRVKLPQPQKIAEDQFTVKPIKNNNPNHNPLDEKGQPANVEKYIDEHFDRATEMYEKKMVDRTREMSQLYFQDVADRFDLQLQLEFVETTSSKNEQTKK